MRALRSWRVGNDAGLPAPRIIGFIGRHPSSELRSQSTDQLLQWQSALREGAAMTTGRLVEVYRAKNSPEAHLLKSALEDAGIRAVVEGDLLQGGLGEIPIGWTTSPRIMVAEPDAGQA